MLRCGARSCALAEDRACGKACIVGAGCVRLTFHRHLVKFNPPAIMNTMLELSMDANYDIIAACLIVAVTVAAKSWFYFKERASKPQGAKVH